MRLLRTFSMAALLGLSSSVMKDAADVCDLYKDCRKLTEGEASLSRKIFGDGIQYNAVSIIKGRFMGLFPFGDQYWAIAPEGNIYVVRESVWSDDYSIEAWKQPFFLHEMTHVWQKYEGVNVIAAAFSLHTRMGVNPYVYDLEKDSDFASMSIEQQAAIVEKYVRLSVPPEGVPIDCADLNRHYAALSQAMNVQPVPELCA